MRLCLKCSKVYEPKFEGQRFCSEECGVESEIKRSTIANQVLRKCITCGTEFWGSLKGRRLYCTKECKHRYFIEHASDTNLPRIVVESRPRRSVTVCQICGKEINALRSYSAKTCSEECANKLRRMKYNETLERRKVKKRAQDQSLEDVMKICVQYDIDYKDYQTMQYLGTWNTFIEERANA